VETLSFAALLEFKEERYPNILAMADQDYKFKEVNKSLE